MLATQLWISEGRRRRGFVRPDREMNGGDRCRRADDLRQLWQPLVDQLAAVEVARVCGALEWRVHGGRALCDITGMASSAPDLPVVLDLIRDKAVVFLGAEAGSLVLICQDTGEMAFEVVDTPGYADLVSAPPLSRDWDQRRSGPRGRADYCEEGTDRPALAPGYRRSHRVCCPVHHHRTDAQPGVRCRHDRKAQPARWPVVQYGRRTTPARAYSQSRGSHGKRPTDRIGAAPAGCSKRGRTV